MNPFVSSLVGALARWVVTVAATREMMVSEDQVSQVVYGLVSLVSLAWSVWQKRHADEKLTRARRGDL